ncbi:MAG: hypothetical protein IT285_13885 [Bdellovibrionales bacterium]|nr:hypothetical protein [Bdellovibrionales bacterium]
MKFPIWMCLLAKFLCNVSNTVEVDPLRVTAGGLDLQVSVNAVIEAKSRDGYLLLLSLSAKNDSTTEVPLLLSDLELSENGQRSLPPLHVDGLGFDSVPVEYLILPGAIFRTEVAVPLHRIDSVVQFVGLTREEGRIRQSPGRYQSADGAFSVTVVKVH